MFVTSQKLGDLRPIINQIKKRDEEDFLNAWELYKTHIRTILDEETPATSAPSTPGFITAGVKSLTGIDLTKVAAKRSNNLIDRIEAHCSEVRGTLKKEYARVVRDSEKMMKEHEEQMKAQMEEIAEGDYTVLDYLMGNGPQSMGGAGKK